MQQDGGAADIQRGQRADVDAGPVGVLHPDDHGRQAGGPGQRDGAEVPAFREPVIGRVKVGAGIADRCESVDGEILPVSPYVVRQRPRHC